MNLDEPRTRGVERIRRSAFVACLVLGVSVAVGCEGDPSRTLRGAVRPSRDGETYLVIDDDNGGGCGDLLVDGAVWPHPIGTAARIEPGLHAIHCGSVADFHPDNTIQFRVPEGVEFRFDYWGP